MRRLAFWVSVAMVFTLPFENIIDTPPLGRISRVAGLAAAAVWLPAVLTTGRVRSPKPFHALFFAFVLWNGLSAFWSVDVPATVGRFITYAQLLLMVYILWDTIATRVDLAHVLQAYVLGSWVTVLSVFHGYLFTPPAQYQIRFGAGSFQLDDIGLILALGVPVAWYLAMNPPEGRWSRWLRLVNLLHVPAAVIAIMLTGSRAALVAVVPALVFMAMSLRELDRNRRWATIGAVVALFLLLRPLVPTETLARLESSGSQAAGGDLNGRVELWRAAFLTFEQHPFTGVGSAAFRETESNKVAHDLFFRLVAELGLVGLALVAALVLTAFVSGWRHRGMLRGLWTSVLTAWLIGATFYNLEDKKQTWVFLSLAVVNARLPAPVSRRREPDLRVGGASTVRVRVPEGAR